MARMILTSALCLCAAGKAGLMVEEKWKDPVRKAIGKLDCWKCDAQDLKRGSDVLKELISN